MTSKQPLLTPSELQIVRSVFKARTSGWGPIRVYIFGSRSHVQCKPHSDLDLALESEQPLDFQFLSDLKDDFTASDLPFRVDLLDLSKAQGSFKARVLAEMISLEI